MARQRHAVIVEAFSPKRIGVVSPRGRDLDPLRSSPSRIEWIHVPSADLDGPDYDAVDAVLVLADEVAPELVRFIFVELSRITVRPLLGVHRQPETLEGLADVALPTPQSKRDVLLMAQRITRIVYSIEDDTHRGSQWRQITGVVAIVATVPAVALGIQTGDAALAAETAGAVITTVLGILCAHGMRSRPSARGRQ